jgi:lysophospholipid acyltransferase (LPLAT)-like uncharacterized protein
LGLLVRFWTLTLFVRQVWSPSLQKNESRPWVLCFWHGTQLPMLAARRRRGAVAMVSHSRDGQMQRVSLTLQGLRTVRGSSSKGGATGVRSLARVMRDEGKDGLFAVDGPRGPYGKAKSGAISAAKLTGARLVPVGAAMTHGHVFSRAWDKFMLPWPLTRVAIVIGEPIEPDADDALERLERAIDECNLQARRELSPTPALHGATP